MHISFTDSARFMASSLSSLVDNLSKEIHKVKYEECDWIFENKSADENLIKYKFLYCNKNYSNKIDEELKN